jgi:hypothetical protein
MRVKAFFVMAVALFWSASVFPQSFTIGAFETGNKLLEACSEGHDITQGYCKGYAVGVADAISAVNAMKANGMAIPSVCIPREQKVTTEQVRDVVVQPRPLRPDRGLRSSRHHARPRHVRFTPESGHWNSAVKCPLCAIIGSRCPASSRG